jgi:hypothetical protein
MTFLSITRTHSTLFQRWDERKPEEVRGLRMPFGLRL